MMSMFTSLASLAQGDLDVPEDYISEFIYGVNFNTNSGVPSGLMLKSTKIIKPKVYRSIGLELVHIKNPKELRFPSLATGSAFIYGKRNSLFSVRPQYGRDFILFRKAPEEGIQVSAIFAGGPSFGLLIPYYILYNFQNGGVQSVHYDPLVHNEFNRILGPGNLFDGLGETRILLGVHAKAGMSLDFGAFRNTITGVEIGVSFETFTQTPEIMVAPNPGNPPVPNTRFFTAFYVNLFFGTRK